MQQSNAEWNGTVLGRRDFIKGVSLGALGAGLTMAGIEGVFAEEAGEEPRMRIRRLGRTDLKISEIGLGGAALGQVLAEEGQALGAREDVKGQEREAQGAEQVDATGGEQQAQAAAL